MPELRHPGPRHPVRRQGIAVATRAVHTVLPPHTPLVDALAAVVEATGHTSGQVELSGGVLDRISYCVPALCDDGSVAASYSATREAACPAQVLTGSVTVGFREGRRFAHCHAVWLEPGGALRAGHLWPDSRTGDVPVGATVFGLSGVDMVNARDDETHMPCFAPVPGTAGDPVGGPAVIARIRPGEDVTGAVTALSREHDLAGATVRGSLGSLAGGVLAGPSGPCRVDGPATEVVLSGAVRDGEARLSAVLVDRHGAVHAGALVPGANPVAVTAEVLIVGEERT
ncbi:DUF296 domain-containing protein [Pseudonocardia nematodicida]|uniref:DUF296 domain-containing protein n=1 Tax=Pseudonocardia nematodicida TaxID=1206997 RepID=A0ABV1KIF3_9PSEU